MRSLSAASFQARNHEARSTPYVSIALTTWLSVTADAASPQAMKAAPRSSMPT